MRQIVLDTETTGLAPAEGHRIIEIGAVELVDRRFTGHNFHEYINPEREVEAGALAVHGITNKFLLDKPLFSAIMEKFINYVTGAELIIHNAPFDVGFLNHEFRLQNKSAQALERFTKIFDTLSFARKKHPGKKNNLDALCKRYGIDNSKRELHGALLDAQLLAETYLAMTGGQMHLFGGSEAATNAASSVANAISAIKGVDLAVIKATDEELGEHQGRLEAIKKVAGVCLWEA
ncbi:MAG: DNA polymerase III subunit epsilon [Gammaproteobacteria bacterium]|nr:DNA polymerase III subunit epsilon [Gammaproteobacteria bacterium]